MKKIVIFHICALPHLYVKVGTPPPDNFFSGSAPVIDFTIVEMSIFYILHMLCKDECIYTVYIKYQYLT